MFPTTVGLIIALFGPAVVALAGGKLVGRVTPLAGNIAGQIALLLPLAAVLSIVMLCEHQPLASIGIRPPSCRPLSGVCCSRPSLSSFIPPRSSGC